jgi:hypothetical protein
MSVAYDACSGRPSTASKIVVDSMTSIEHYLKLVYKSRSSGL